MELKADAKPGKTGDEEGTPAAAAAAAATATDATGEGVAPGSPMKEDNTGLPAPCPPETPNPGKAVGLVPGGRPGNIEGAVVRPRLKGEAALAAAPGAKPWYMEVGGGLEILLVGGITGMDAEMVEGGTVEERDGKWDRPGK